MGKLHTCFVVAVSALAACGDDGGNAKADAGMPDSGPDAKVYMDAPPPTFDFSCAGNAAPTTAAANVTLTGDVTRIGIGAGGVEFAALGGAALKACTTGTNCAGQDQLDTDTSAADGSFTLGPLATGATPLDAYISMTAANSRPTYTYPAQPFTADQGNIPILTFDSGLLALAGAQLGCPQNDTSNGIVGIAVTDCADAPITESQDINLIVKQNGAAVAGTSVVDLGSLDARAAGTFLVCNVPANGGSTTTEVGATYKTTMQLRAHNVKVVAGATTATILRPGF